MAANNDEARNRCLIRCLSLARRLDGLRYAPALSDLASEYGVSERTIRRDLKALEAAQWPVPQWRHNEYSVDLPAATGLARWFKSSVGVTGG